jgi:hypothetical protein
MGFEEGDRFYLKADPSRRGTVVRVARIDEFGCDLYFGFTYYVVDMDGGANAPIQTGEGGLAETSDLVRMQKGKKE